MNPSALQAQFSSATPEWSTPQDFFDKLNEEFGFTLDVCATPENKKCRLYFSPDVDGLSKSWNWNGVPHPVWMNPPYGNPEKVCKSKCTKKRCAKRGWHRTEYLPGVVDWVKKAVTESKLGVTVVALLPARPDSRWFQDFVLPYAELRWVRGRLKFGGSKNSAPFPSVVAVYRGAKQ